MALSISPMGYTTEWCFRWSSIVRTPLSARHTTVHMRLPCDFTLRQLPSASASGWTISRESFFSVILDSFLLICPRVFISWSRLFFSLRDICFIRDWRDISTCMCTMYAPRTTIRNHCSRSATNDLQVFRLFGRPMNLGTPVYLCNIRYYVN